MSIIEFLNSECNFGEFILFNIIAFIVWCIIWHLILKKLLNKCDWGSDFVDMGKILGPLAAFGILIFLSILICLFITSIQVILVYGAKLILPLIVFWGGITTFFVLLIRHIKK